MSTESTWVDIVSPWRQNRDQPSPRRPTLVPPSPTDATPPLPYRLDLLSKAHFNVSPLSSSNEASCVSSTSTTSSDSTMPTATEPPVIDLFAMIQRLTNQPVKPVQNPTRDFLTQDQFNLGTILAKIPLLMKNIDNASFPVDNLKDWKQRHKNTATKLLDFLTKPPYQDPSSDWPTHLKYERALRHFQHYKYLRNEVLSYLEVVYPGKLNSVKYRGLFEKDFTLHQAFDHIKNVCHFGYNSLD